VSRIHQNRPQRSAGARAEAVGSPWRWRAFRRLVEAQLAHAAGDVLVAVALADTIFFSVPLGEARSKVALYLLLTIAPFAVLSPMIGPWLDRRPGSYRVAIVAAMAGRVALAILLSSRSDQVALYPLAFGLLVLSRVHGVSRSAVVPDAVPPGRTLQWSNAVLAVASVAGGAVAAGPALALNRLAGTDATLWAAAVVFAVGALAATGLPLGEPTPAPGRRSARAGRARAPRGARRGARAPRGRLAAQLPAPVQAAAIAMATLRGSVGFVTFLLAFLLRAEGAGGAGLALLVVAAGLGALAGPLLAAGLRLTLREAPVLLACLVLIAVAAVWAGTGFNVPWAVVVAGVVGFAAGVGRLAFDGLLQKDAPEQVRARAFARYEAIFQLCWVLAGGLAAAYPYRPRGGLWSLAVICLGGAALSAWRQRTGDRGLPIGPAVRTVAASVAASVAGGVARAVRDRRDALRRHRAAEGDDARAPEPAPEPAPPCPPAPGRHGPAPRRRAR